jgi:hypothetical protein
MNFDAPSASSIAAATAVAVAVTTALIVGFGRRGHKKRQHSKTHESWESHVGEHGPLREIWPGTLYILEAPGCTMGPPVRNMIIYRVPDQSGRLVIFNGIAVNASTTADIEQLGTPTVLIVPNGLHRCCAAVWKAKYPELIVVCPAGAVDKVSEIVSVSMTTQNWATLADWTKWIQAKEIDGWCEFETVVEVSLDPSEKGKRAMLVCDLLFTLPLSDKAGFIERLIVWFFDSSVRLPADGTIIIPKISRIGRVFGVKDWPKVEQWYRSYARNVGRSIAVIAVGHGLPVVQVDTTLGCTKALEGIAEQLVKPRW